jgi:hypothetical protein
MKKLLTVILNAFAFGLICFISFIVLRPISSASTATELPASVQASFNKDVSEAILSNQKTQVELLTEQKIILQKIDANVNRLVGEPTVVVPPAPKLIEVREAVEAEPSFSSTTSRGLFRRGSTVRQPTGTPSK